MTIQTTGVCEQAWGHRNSRQIFHARQNFAFQRICTFSHFEEITVCTITPFKCQNILYAQSSISCRKTIKG